MAKEKSVQVSMFHQKSVHFLVTKAKSVQISMVKKNSVLQSKVRKEPNNNKRLVVLFYVLSTQNKRFTLGFTTLNVLNYNFAYIFNWLVLRADLSLTTLSFFAFKFRSTPIVSQ